MAAAGDRAGALRRTGEESPDCTGHGVLRSTEDTADDTAAGRQVQQKGYRLRRFAAPAARVKWRGKSPPGGSESSAVKVNPSGSKTK